MALWIEQQHSALLEDLTAAVQRREVIIVEEYNRRQEAHNKTVKSLLDLKDQRIIELSDEVESLKKRIANTISTSSPLAVPSPLQIATSPAEGTKSPASNDTQQPPDFKAKYLGYKNAYDALKGNHRKLWNGYNSEKAAKQQAQTELADLQAKYDGVQRKLNGLDHIGQDGAASENGIDVVRQLALPVPQPPTATAPTIDDGENKQEQEEVAAVENMPAQSLQSPTLPPLLFTADDDDLPIKQECSSSPVIMSERPVRKRGRAELSHTQKRVKTEHSSQSTPRALSTAEVPGSEDSLDLGEVGQHLATPKKRKDQESCAAETTPTLVFQQPSGITPLRDQPSGYVKALTNTVRPAPLTPLDPNRMANRKSTKRSKRTKEDVLHGVKILAEDGNGDEGRKTDENAAVTPAPKSRLDDLLNTPSDNDTRPGVPRHSARRPGFATPRGESLLAKSRGKSRSTRSTADELMIPRARELPWQSARKEKGGNEKQSEASPATPAPRTTKAAQDVSTKAARKTHGSLRTKPVSELRIGDFKVNPAANDGYDFAYTDVVRGKESRSKIGGCVDMHCCGKEMRALALSDRPEPPLTAAQQEEEHKYLEDYLGDFSYKLKTMDQVERDELWLKAKTQELADKYSKHRDRFRRVQSPPGFWNADFPSTQDIQAEKAEAAKKVRETVEDRYREALRPGGLWMFRDED